MTLPPMADGVPGRQHLTGYRLTSYDDLIAKLAASRRAQQLTLAQVGERAHHPLQNISVWLRGDVEPTTRNAFALADALGYDLALIPREDA